MVCGRRDVTSTPGISTSSYSIKLEGEPVIALDKRRKNDDIINLAMCLEQNLWTNNRFETKS